jgi:hypothetical protein
VCPPSQSNLIPLTLVLTPQNHSEVPEADEDWPSLASILAFRDRVRTKLARVYAEVGEDRRVMDRGLARTLMMCLEHEGWHIEVGPSIPLLPWMS